MKLKDNKSKKLQPYDLMYFIELVASDSEQNASFRHDAIITLLELNKDVIRYKVGRK